VFYYFETQLNSIILGMTESTSYFYPPLADLAAIAAVMFFIALTSISLLKDAVIDTTFTASYLLALSRSIVLFSLSSGIRALLIGSRLISILTIRKGILAIAQRFFVLLRNLITVRIWLTYLCQDQSSGLFDLISGPRTIASAGYLLLKCFMQLWLLWDLGSTVRVFGAKPICTPSEPEEVSDRCTVCLDTPTEPVRLPCGHIFCYACVHRWLQEHDVCPMCCTNVCGSAGIECGDGSIPWGSFFVAF
jgi:hypothetical protein